MPNLNKCILAGNMTRDVEIRVTPKGTAIGAFGLAINRKWKDDSGETREDVTFVDIEAWGRTAETIAKYASKGDPLLVEGRLKLDQWEDKNGGGKRSKMKVVCENFQFLGNRKPQDSEGPAPASRQLTPAPATSSDVDDDVPY